MTTFRPANPFLWGDIKELTSLLETTFIKDIQMVAFKNEPENKDQTQDVAVSLAQSCIYQ